MSSSSSDDKSTFQQLGERIIQGEIDAVLKKVPTIINEYDTYHNPIQINTDYDVYKDTDIKHAETIPILMEILRKRGWKLVLHTGDIMGSWIEAYASLEEKNWRAGFRYKHYLLVPKKVE